MPCKLCGGRKHVLRGKRWVRCSCVLEAVRASTYAKAGVPLSLAQEPLYSLQGQSLLLYAGVPIPLLPGKGLLAWLHAPDLSPARARTAAHAIRAYVDAGMDAARLRIGDVVESQFDKDIRPAIQAAWRKAQCLVLELSNDTGNKMVPQLLRQVYEHRAGMHALTIFASADDIGQMPARYGSEVSSAFRARAGIVYVARRLKPLALAKPLHSATKGKRA